MLAARAPGGAEAPAGGVFGKAGTLPVERCTRAACDGQEGCAKCVRRWAFAKVRSLCVFASCRLQWAPVAPRWVGLCALLAADFGRPGGSLRTDEELLARRASRLEPIWCALTRSCLVLAAVCRLERIPEGQNEGLPSLSPARLVSIVPATLELPLVCR